MENNEQPLEKEEIKESQQIETEIIDEQQEKKQTEETIIAELQDKLMRNIAEFDNYRKRTTKEKASMYDQGVKDTIEKLLPVVDSFQRATKSLQGSDHELHKGILMIYRQLESFLTDIGIIAIQTEDQIFDPNLHNAVTSVDLKEHPSGAIVEELQKGYMYKDKVIRHSMVKVVI